MRTKGGSRPGAALVACFPEIDKKIVEETPQSVLMKRFIARHASEFARRAGHVAIVVTLLAVGTFMMLELLPGNLADSLLGENSTPEEIARIEADLGLDRPMGERFGLWAWNVLHGDLGRSPLTGEEVAHSIATRLPVSLELMVLAQLIALFMALPLGLLAGYREGSRVDSAISGAAFGVLSVPHFVLGIVLILVFAIELRWFPATGFRPLSDGLGVNLASMFLPALTLALVEAPVYLRLLRSDIATTLREEFVTVARAKGLSDFQVLVRHALRPSSFSLITVMGINIGHLIGGAVIIETLFALPGVGRLLIESITRRDYLTLQGVVLFIGVSFVVVNLLVDALYAVLDPRIGARGRR